MIMWKSLVGNMKEDMRKTQLDEEAKFDPGFKAEDNELFTHMHDKLLHKIADSHDSIEEERKEKVAYKSTGHLKRWAVLAASLVLVLGLGATSIGSKPHQMKIVKMVRGGKLMFGAETGDVKNMYEEAARVKDAALDIDQKLGIKSAKILWRPLYMVYENSHMDLKTGKASMRYKDQYERTITFNIETNKDHSFSVDKAEFTVIQQYSLQVQTNDILVIEYENKVTKKRQFIATFSDDYAVYNISSNIKQKEFDTLLKSLYFAYE